MNRPHKHPIPRLVAVVATVAAIGFTIYLSLDPKNYYFSLGQERASWVYEPRHVLLTTGFMLGESVCAGAALFFRPPRALWLRCLLGLFVLGPWALTVTPFVLHMPLYFLFHHVWLWLLIGMLILVALGSISRDVLRHLRRSRLSSHLSGPA